MSGFLVLASLAVAAGTDTTGERALLNRTHPTVRALLIRTSDAEPAVASTLPGVPATAADVGQVDGPRAPQGVGGGAAEPSDASHD